MWKNVYDRNFEYETSTHIQHNFFSRSLEYMCCSDFTRNVSGSVYTDIKISLFSTNRCDISWHFILLLLVENMYCFLYEKNVLTLT